MARLQIIGGGKMGEALVGGLLERGWASPAELTVVEKLGDRRDLLTRRAARRGRARTVPRMASTRSWPSSPMPSTTCAPSSRATTCGGCCRSPRGFASPDSRRNLGERAAVVRAMPNTPALVGLGAAAIARGTHATDADIAWAQSILSSVGEVLEVEEPLLDAVTGPVGFRTRICLLVGRSNDRCGRRGRSAARRERRARPSRRCSGSATLLRRSNDGPDVLRQNVTSPGGTTAAGLAVFENARFRQIVVDVVTAATKPVDRAQQHVTASRFTVENKLHFSSRGYVS